jgi:Raf kinase inhibitor-like YbhB/YbcL family protein
VKRRHIVLENLPAGIGRVLRGARPGLSELVFNDEALAEVDDSIAVTSSAFGDGGELPARFTADGEGISPPLQWTGVPEGAAEIVLLVEDADSPTPYPLVQAIVWNLSPEDGSLAEGAMPQEAQPATSPSMGVNSYLRIGYLPPDPPPGHGPHNYAFQVFALRTPLVIETAAPGRTELVAALHAFAVAKGMLIATYERE